MGQSNYSPRDSKKSGKWHYVAATKLSALLRGKLSKHNGDFCCLGFPHSFRTKNKCDSHEKSCKNKKFCNILTPNEESKI